MSDPLALALLALAGLSIGVASSMVGIGGGVFMVPLLILGYGLSPPEAVGTSLLVIVPMALSSTEAYRKSGHTRPRPALLLALAGVAGVVGGSIATRRVEPRLIALAFAGLSGALALYLLLRRPPGGEQERGEVPRSRLPVLAPLGGMVGFASGFLGIGGGALMVPGLAALGLDIRGSVATSLLAMVPITLAGAMAHGQLGNLSLPHAGALALGAILGGQIGPRLAERVPRKRLEQGLALVLLYAATRMALS